MADTGGERITDTFKLKHHPLPKPTITQADCIVDAAAWLSSAIANAQAASPDELKAIAFI